MWRKILNRFIATIIVLIGVSVIAFALVRLGGGDPAALVLPDTATEEQIEEQRVKMGLDKPLVVQYVTYISNVLHGDLGYSYHYNMNVSKLIAYRLPNTARLALFSLIISLLWSVPLGLIAGIKKGTPIDSFAMLFAIVGQSMSTVWLSLMLILIFGVKLKWLPTQGYESFKNIIMPGICQGFAFSANVTRMLRSGMIDVLQEDHITATRARGIGKFKVYTKYALKNALVPVITIIGSQFGFLMAGSILIESVFGWPGVGELMMTAISSRDYQLVQSILLISAFIFVICNLLADIAYTLIDKRIEFN
ncbi:MAG: ABC transporter permease [Lachnospiraceae bacterium]|nr:ABC transporter permease [Lachnospiraceae bacterium]